MQFAVLGPLQVSQNGCPVGLGGPKQRALLAFLLLHANTVVSRDRLIDSLWGECPPPSAAESLDVYLSRLRKLVGHDRLSRQAGGYVLHVAPGELDSEQFECMVTNARQAAEAGDGREAARMLAGALALWRGPALADVLYQPFAGEPARQLEERRLEAIEARVEAELGCGAGATLVPELEQLVAGHPLRERLVAALMLALYQAGRQADALAAFQAARGRLVEDLGLEPGPEMCELQQRILGHDPALAAKPGAPGAFAAAATRALPRDIAAFTGREAELARLARALAAAAAASGGVVGIHAIGGMAGVGKTTFAVHAAHQLAAGFPDGQFFLPLHAHTAGQRPVDPADALASLLLTSGLPAAQIPPGVDARAARWRDHAAGKKILLVLDDAAGHEQVRPLLPGTPGSLVLVTSRRRLVALEDAAVVSLDTLSPGEAAELLARLAGRADVTAGDPGVGQLAALCGYLPLAIGMTGRQLAHHPAWSAADLAADLGAARNRLELMHAEDLSVAAAFGLSYRDLDAAQRRLFRRLGLHPGPDVDAYAAAAVDGTGVAAARRRLEALYDQHLITEPARGRYRLHDLIREHARTLAAAGDPAARDAAAGRLLDYYLHTTRAAGQHIPSWTTTEGPAPPGPPPASAPPVSTQQQAAAWLETERANLHAAAGYAAASGRPSYAVLIPAAMDGFLDNRGRWDQGVALNQAAVAAARQAGDRPGQAYALLLLVNMQAMTEDPSAAADSATRALELYRGLGDRAGQAAALHAIGAVYMGGDYPAAASALRQALELFRGLGHRRGQGDALTYLGTVHRITGDYPAAIACHRQALELYRDLGHPRWQGEALLNLGAMQRLVGDYPAAAAALRQAPELYRDLDDSYWQARILTELAALQRLTGDYAAAAASSQQAVGLFRDLRHRPNQAWALNELGLVQQLTGDYPAAAASHQQALRLSREVSSRLLQAETLNSLGELSSRTAANRQARHHHSEALAIARELGTSPEEARALEGIGRSHLRDNHTSEGTAHLQQALAIYQRIGSPAARRVQQTLLQLRRGNMAPTPER
jgi:DNA-binding SARP family transcriptional activator/tetratricopeptide (TPR) repeat protein